MFPPQSMPGCDHAHADFVPTGDLVHSGPTFLFESTRPPTLERIACANNLVFRASFPQRFPMQYQGHPLLQGSPFFTLPEALLDSVVKSIGRERFDSDLLDMERAPCPMRLVNPPATWAIGEGNQSTARLLRPLPMQFSDGQIADFAAQNGLTVAAVRRSLDVGDGRLQWAVVARRGYCGWLMSNRQFLDEHAAILESWADEVRRRGIPAMGPAVRDVNSFPGDVMRATGSTRDFIQEFEQFFIRWRLEALTAPWLPAPLAPQTARGRPEPSRGAHASRGNDFLPA